MEIFSDTIIVAAVVSLGLTILAKLLPNEKVYDLGFSVGEWLNGIGSAKLGSKVWEKIEDFLINSSGKFFEGMKDGLNEGEDEQDSS